MCSNTTVPERLHKKGRDAEPKFFLEEIIYRRFEKEPVVSPEGRISPSIFPLQFDSCLRKEFCEEYKDTLYSDTQSNNSHFYAKWGVVGFPYGNFISSYPVDNKNDDRVFDVTVIHTPTDCMYPHCEVISKLDDKIESPPKSVKSKIREHLARVCKVCKRPDAD